MTDAVAHRGPDGEGFYTDGPSAFGHRRLAIIDLVRRGRQPMVNDDGDYRPHLQRRGLQLPGAARRARGAGHRFRSRQRFRGRALRLRGVGRRRSSRFNGMFAFAIWDAPAPRLLLARDRYGIKPLYWYAARQPVPVRLGGQGAPRSIRDSTPSSTTRALARILHVPELHHRHDAVQGSHAAAGGHIPHDRPAEGSSRGRRRFWDYDSSEARRLTSAETRPPRSYEAFRAGRAAQLVSRRAGRLAI